MGKILIEEMEFYAYHGCFIEEQIVGNKFLVDIEIDTNIEISAITDNLNETINYQTVYLLTKKEMEIKSKLLENVAKRICNSLIDNFPRINSLKIKVSKLNPPLGGKIKKVSVVYTYSNI